MGLIHPSNIRLMVFHQPVYPPILTIPIEKYSITSSQRPPGSSCRETGRKGKEAGAIVTPRRDNYAYREG